MKLSPAQRERRERLRRDAAKAAVRVCRARGLFQVGARVFGRDVADLVFAEVDYAVRDAAWRAAGGRHR